MAEELYEIRLEWMQRAAETEGSAKIVSKLVVAGLMYNDSRDKEGRVYLHRPLQQSTHFAPPCLEPANLLDERFYTETERIKTELEKTVDAFNKRIDLAWFKRRFEINAANFELLDIALSFDKRAKLVECGLSEYYAISEKRSPSKSKAPKRRRKEE